MNVNFASGEQAKGGWSIADVSAADGAMFTLSVGGVEIASAAFGEAITAEQSADYAGWGFSLDNGTLKFARIA